MKNSDSLDRCEEEVVFVIFGVTGDLTRRKLFPALYQLKKSGRLPDKFSIIGFARRDWNDDLLRQTAVESVYEFGREQPSDEIVLKQLLATTYFIRSDFDDESGYQRLGEKLKQIHACNIIYYLATPPDAYETIIQYLGTAGLAEIASGWTRIIVEKPYGEDLTSANALEETIHEVFQESQIFRIDHYLGKETVQNILVLRFANGIFEPMWNLKYVDHVQITVAETVGVGRRAGYYDTAGVIRDVFQNHLLQLLCLTAMEAPVAFNADAVRDEKVKVLKSLRPMRGKSAQQNTYRAQYVSGIIDGQKVVGYKDEVGANPNSVTETFMAARLFVDNWRWAGVPFYVRSGKRLPRRVTEIAVQFKQVPLSLFDWKNLAGDAPNVLILTLQPDEGITLTFGAKKPGPINEIAPVHMNFSYQDAFGGEPPEAYERLLLDCMMGDATLFTRSDEVQAQWAFTTEILQAWKEMQVNNLPVYEAGTWGPPGVDDFIHSSGRSWRNL